MRFKQDSFIVYLFLNEKRDSNSNFLSRKTAGSAENTFTRLRNVQAVRGEFYLNIFLYFVINLCNKLYSALRGIGFIELNM